MARLQKFGPECAPSAGSGVTGDQDHDKPEILKQINARSTVAREGRHQQIWSVKNTAPAR